MIIKIILLALALSALIGFIFYLILSKIEKTKLNKIRREYESKNLGIKTEGAGEEGNAGDDRISDDDDERIGATEFDSPVESGVEESGDDKLDSASADGISENGTAKNKRRRKSIRFKPIG